MTETLPACSAVIQFLSSVNPLMWFLSSVDPLVPFQISICNKSLLTLKAHIFSHTSVYLLMCFFRASVWSEICRDRVYWRTERTWEIQNPAEWNTLKNKQVITQFIRFSVLVEIKHKPINNIDETFYVQGTKQIVVFNFLVFIKYSVKGDHKSN